MIRSFLKRQLAKATTTDLAMAGLCRQVHQVIVDHPGSRAYQVGKRTFGCAQDPTSYDHKNMLTWACIIELEKRNQVIRVYPVRWSAVDQATKDELDDLMFCGLEDKWSDKLAELPKERYPLFYPCGFPD